MSNHVPTTLRLLLILVGGLFSLISFSQTYTHSGSGVDQSYTVTCGGTYNYYDDGGIAGNYDWDVFNDAIVTFNPSAGGNFIRINFTSFDIEGCGGASCTCDGLNIYDGASTASPLIGTYCNNNVPGTITSTTGSLTVEFYSDGSVEGSGWQAQVSCYSPCATASGTASATPNSFCPNGNASLSLAGEDPSASIQWQVSTNGGTTWSNIAGAITDPWIQPVLVNSMYRAQVTNGCTSTSNSVAVTVGCPPIIQPTSGSSTATATCGASLNFYDSGNVGSNYGNSENGLITISPSTPGQYVSVNFTAFSLENNYDYLYIFDGDDGGAQLIGVYTSTTSPGTVTASSANASGALSFRFNSDGATISSGWEATVTCTAIAGSAFPASGVEDCNGAITICSNSALVGGTTGMGLDELPNDWNSCIADGENQSNWYVFSPSTSGTIGFEIVPTSPTDYDWAIWGPYTFLQCPAFTNDTPIRCSSTQLIGNGNTGLVAPAADVIEQNGEYGGGANENGFLAPMVVNAGEIYVMMLDNWSGSSVGFQLDWNLTNGASLDCTPLPINLTSFKSECQQNHSKISWVTESETNNNYFLIEKADEEFQFHEIGRINGSGTTTIQHEYSFTDPEVNEQTGYYRLSQIDFDGKLHRHKVIASNCQNGEFEVISTAFNGDALDIKLSTSTNEELNIQLYDLTGKLIANNFSMVNAGFNLLRLPNVYLNGGTYLLSIKGQYNSYSKKLMLTK